MASDSYQAEGTENSSPAKIELDGLNIPEGQHVTVHMIHLNHLDLTWYWQLSDTVEMCLETIRWMTKFLYDHPDARYSHTQPFILKVVEDLDPETFKLFSQLVSENRVEIDSGQWIETDHNLPSGESLARQFLYGQRYIESRFGKRSITVVNSDSFGHTRSLPQIMKLSGIDHFLFKRPREKDVHLPEYPFLWKGIDGTEIPSCRFINKGGGLPSLSQYYDLREGTSDLQQKVSLNLSAGFNHLFGTHCASDAGGVTPYVSPAEGKGYSLKYDIPTEFFKAVLALGNELEVVDCPLNYVYPGCYTTHIDQKENCRRAETEMRALELLWTHAALLGFGYPSDAINETWRRLCYLQFHDILPGTGSPEASRDSNSHYHELFLQTNILRRRAQIIIDSVCGNNSKSLRSFLVANPRPVDESGITSSDVELPISREANDGICIPDTGLLADDDGDTYPYQIVNKRFRQRFIRGEMIFNSPAIPALGIRSLSLVDGEPETSTVSASGSILENEKLRVEIGGNGIIKSIITRPDGKNRLRAIDAPVRIECWPETYWPGDYGSPMKAWFIGTTEDRENVVKTSEPVIIENGPVRATIRTEFKWGESTFISDVSLYAGSDFIEIANTIDWHEKDVLVRLCVEPNLSGKYEYKYGIPFGTETASPSDLEVPAIGWSDISGETGGIALLDRGNPGRTFRDDCLRVSLVRCATGDFDPQSDVGIIKSTIRIVPHDGRAEDADIPAKADQFNHPLVAWQSEPSRNPRESPGIFEIDGQGIILTSIKASESRGGLIARFYESMGKRARMSLEPSDIFSDCECFLSNITEDEIEKIDLNNELEFRPFEIKTIMIKTNSEIQTIDGFSSSLFSS